MSTVGDEEARAAAARLLGSADRNNASTRALSVAARMPKNPSPAVQRAWRERLEGSERSGAVALVRGAGNRRGVPLARPAHDAGSRRRWLHGAPRTWTSQQPVPTQVRAERHVEQTGSGRERGSHKVGIGW
jgi:hypothetical protein